MSKQSISLYELNEKLKQGIAGLFPFPVWMVAEISEVSARQHCYLELVERDANDKIIAKLRATIWAYTYSMLKPYFETTTGYSLAPELKILVQVEVQYSEVYGLSLNIKDIDPNYTLGDIWQRKQAILKRLDEEGVLHMNKATFFPTIPKNIAVISSEKAAGYQDFMQQLTNNEFGYKFHTHLFAAMMQGEQTRNSIIEALERIFEHETLFDAVVIIRGGGSVSDLSWFDDYELSANAAQFPLPILTGIGHDKDKSILDEVAYKSLKTPTAVADFLIDCFQNFDSELAELSEQFSELVSNAMQNEKQVLQDYANTLRYNIPQLLQNNKHKLVNLSNDLKYIVKERFVQSKNKRRLQQQRLRTLLVNYCQTEKSKLEFANTKLIDSSLHFIQKKQRLLQHKERVAKLLSPEQLLKRGYSITTLNGRVVKNATLLSEGDEIITQTAKGKFTSVVK